jgi:hypothetical protein
VAGQTGSHCARSSRRTARAAAGVRRRRGDRAGRDLGAVLADLGLLVAVGRLPEEQDEVRLGLDGLQRQRVAHELRGVEEPRRPAAVEQVGEHRRPAAPELCGHRRAPVGLRPRPRAQRAKCSVSLDSTPTKRSPAGSATSRFGVPPPWGMCRRSSRRTSSNPPSPATDSADGSRRHAANALHTSAVDDHAAWADTAPDRAGRSSPFAPRARCACAQATSSAVSVATRASAKRRGVLPAGVQRARGQVRAKPGGERRAGAAAEIGGSRDARHRSVPLGTRRVV